jgi:hypothetical protein
MRGFTLLSSQAGVSKMWNTQSAFVMVIKQSLYHNFCGTINFENLSIPRNLRMFWWYVFRTWWQYDIQCWIHVVKSGRSNWTVSPIFVFRQWRPRGEVRQHFGRFRTLYHGVDGLDIFYKRDFDAAGANVYLWWRCLSACMRWIILESWYGCGITREPFYRSPQVIPIGNLQCKNPRRLRKLRTTRESLLFGTRDVIAYFSLVYYNFRSKPWWHSQPPFWSYAGKFVMSWDKCWNANMEVCHVIQRYGYEWTPSNFFSESYLFLCQGPDRQQHDFLEGPWTKLRSLTVYLLGTIIFR